MTSRKSIRSAFVDAAHTLERDDPSPREFKQSTTTTATPPPGTLEDILRRWRPPDTDAKGTIPLQLGDDLEIEDGEDEHDDPMEDTEPEQRQPKMAVASPDSARAKRHRYLREADRHMILQRIDKGEKQAELAREFGVTRAAICHINKNRSQILARSARPDVHEAARHPKRCMSTAAIAQRHLRQQQQRGSARSSSMVYEVPSPSLAIHLTTLRNRETDSSAFSAAADRAFLLLIEEALAATPTRRGESGAMALPQECSDQGNPTCAMVLGESGLPLMKAFRSIQPQSPTGFMTLTSDEPNQEFQLRKMSVPLGLRAHDVFLLDATCVMGDAMCAAIHSLLDFGAQESSICIVTFVVTAAAVAQIQGKFPSVRIVTASVDPEWTSETAVSLGLETFVERYFNTMIVHQRASGTMVGFQGGASRPLQ